MNKLKWQEQTMNAVSLYNIPRIIKMCLPCFANLISHIFSYGYRNTKEENNKRNDNGVMGKNKG